MLGNLFAQPLFMSFLVYLLVWSPPPCIPYISSPNQCLLFATHARTIATSFCLLGHKTLALYWQLKWLLLLCVDQSVELVKQRSQRVTGLQHAASYTLLDHATMPSTEQRQRTPCTTATATYCYCSGFVDSCWELLVKCLLKCVVM